MACLEFIFLNSLLILHNIVLLCVKRHDMTTVTCLVKKRVKRHGISHVRSDTVLSLNHKDCSPWKLRQYPLNTNKSQELKGKISVCGVLLVDCLGNFQ